MFYNDRKKEISLKLRRRGLRFKTGDFVAYFDSDNLADGQWKRVELRFNRLSSSYYIHWIVGREYKNIFMDDPVECQAATLANDIYMGAYPSEGKMEDHFEGCIADTRLGYNEVMFGTGFSFYSITEMIGLQAGCVLL